MAQPYEYAFGMTSFSKRTTKKTLTTKRQKKIFRRKWMYLILIKMTKQIIYNGIVIRQRYVT